MVRDSGTRRRAPRRTTPCSGVRLPAPGELIGDYLLLRLLGTGTMGLVFEAVPQRGGAHVAIKVLSPALWHDGRQIRRLLQEAELARQVHHPGLVEIFACDVLTGGLTYLVMELLAGESLGTRLRLLRGRPLSGGLAVVHQVALALAAVHARSIVHRDLKPDNVMLVADPERPELERAKVLDFGLAMSLDPEALGPHELLGTPDYMAPEQCCAGRVDTPADVYALGVLAYELLSGRLPFDAGHPMQVIRQRLSAAPLPLGRATVVPAEVAALVERMLAREPPARPTMGEVAAQLERLQGLGLISLSPPGPAAPLGEGCAAEPRILIVEDDAELAQALCESLALAGYCCHHEGDGARALDAARRFRPELVLLDVGLPGRSGLTLCWEIKAALGPEPVPVILLSGHTSAAHHGLGRSVGADAYVDKPFAWEQLHGLVHLFLRRGDISVAAASPPA